MIPPPVTMQQVLRLQPKTVHFWLWIAAFATFFVLEAGELSPHWHTRVVYLYGVLQTGAIIFSVAWTKPRIAWHGEQGEELRDLAAADRLIARGKLPPGWRPNGALEGHE